MSNNYQYHSPLDNAYPEPTCTPYYERYYLGGRGHPSGPREDYGQGDGLQHCSYSSSQEHSDSSGDLKGKNPRSFSRNGPSTKDSSVGHTYMDQYKTPSYPAELTCLFGALECRLCEIKVTSPIVAKMHYSGKQHAKKIKVFLQEWCTRTGNPMPVLKDSSVAASSATYIPEYCELCNVNMQTINEKLLHMAGKQHRKNVADPSKAKKRKRDIEYTNTDERFGIGTEFIPPEILEEREVLAAKVAKIPVQETFVCELCDVNAVSQDQLDAHLNGKKHKEKLKKKDSTVPKPVHPNMSILASINKDNRRNNSDYSMHRTPSEYAKNFNCAPCDLWFETRFQLRTHLAGKRHFKKMLKDDSDEYGTCDICDLRFTSFEQYQSHIQGKKHQRECVKGFRSAIETKEGKNEIECKYCPYVGAGIDDHYCDQSLMKWEKYLPNTKLRCEPCAEVFGSEFQMEQHKESRRHMLCLLNKEGGDRVIPEYEHWYCIICKEQHSNQKDYTDHLFSEKHQSLSTEHKSLESKTDLYHCTICDLVFDQEAKDEHLADKSHKRQALKKYTIEVMTEMAIANDRALYYNCPDCPSEGTMNFLQYNAHVLSTKHLDRVIDQGGTH